jgi:hypothetical protein
MSRLLSMAALVVLTGSWGFAQEVKTRMARMDVCSTDLSGAKLTMVAAPENGDGTNASWMDDVKNAQYLTYQMPTGKEWAKMTIRFKADKDGEVSLSLRGDWRPKVEGSEELIPIWIAYDDVTVDGGTLQNGDFEAAAEGKAVGWNFQGEQGFVSAEKAGHGGKGSIKAWHNESVDQNLAVKKDTVVAVTVWCKLAE